MLAKEPGNDKENPPQTLSGVKAKAALAVVKSECMLAAVAQQFDVHPDRITEWKRQLQERAAYFATLPAIKSAA